MATPVVTKIVMKNTTKMSLNERFTAIRAEAQSSVNTYRQKMQLQRQASSANLRLAQQMANRPTVMAALRIKKKSLQQRLGQSGSNVKSRLNFNGNRANNSSMFGRRQQSASNVKARLNLNSIRPRPNNQLQGRLGNVQGRLARRRGGFKPGTSPLIKARLGAPKQQSQNQRGAFRARRGSFRGRGVNRPLQGNRFPATRNIRGNSRGGPRGRGGRWRGQIRMTPKSRQELDNELDEYMAETKGALDDQLGQYMAQAHE